VSSELLVASGVSPLTSHLLFLLVLRIFLCIFFGTQLDDIAVNETGFDFEEFESHFYLYMKAFKKKE